MSRPAPPTSMSGPSMGSPTMNAPATPRTVTPNKGPVVPLRAVATEVEALVVSTGQASRRSRRSKRRLGRDRSRSLHSREDRSAQACKPGADASPETLVPPRLSRPHRPAADGGRGGGVCSLSQSGTKRTRRSSTSFSRRRASANVGLGTGSTSCATPIPSAARGTRRSPMPGAIATTSSTPSTPTCRTIGSSPSNSPAILLSSNDVDERRAQLTGAGLLGLGSLDLRETSGQFVMDQIDDQIDVTTRAFLGLTIACARCHDHKYDPVSMHDYYALAGHLLQHRHAPGPGESRHPRRQRATSIPIAW